MYLCLNAGLLSTNYAFNTAMCCLYASLWSTISASMLIARCRFCWGFVCVPPHAPGFSKLVPFPVARFATLAADMGLRGFPCLATGQLGPRRDTAPCTPARLADLAYIWLAAWQPSLVSWHRIGLTKNTQVRQKSHCYRNAKRCYNLDIVWLKKCDIFV